MSAPRPNATHNGRVTITLPRLSRGTHLVTARYSGNDQLTGSTSWPSVVIVF